MKILNIHKRILNEPKENITELLATLSTENDRIWPKEKWPAMRFKSGIGLGAKGGHGPIRYTVEKYDPQSLIQFRFSSPKEFNGIHKFEICELSSTQTKIKHTIDMKAIGKGTLIWNLAVRSLHNALIEDAFDKLENNFLHEPKITEWNSWVKCLRKIMPKGKRK